MSKLNKLKTWLTLDDAAKQLSILCSENVTTADILQMALEGKLALSVIFSNSPFVWKGHQSEYTGEKIPVKIKDNLILEIEMGVRLSPKYKLVLDTERVSLNSNNVYDLLMVGNEKRLIESSLRTLLNWDEKREISTEGAFVISKDHENIFAIQGTAKDEAEVEGSIYFEKLPHHHIGYIPATSLPKGSELVLRTEVLTNLISKMLGNNTEIDRPLNTRERDTLLTIIAVLCKEVNFNYKTHAKTAGLIQSTAATMGISIGETTIEGHLKKIPNALATRIK